MRYTMIAFDPCGGGTCPTIYRDEAKPGDVLVQGYVLDASEAAELNVPKGETVVRVPSTLLGQLTGGGDG